MQLRTINIPASDLKQSTKFYELLLGHKLEPNAFDTTRSSLQDIITENVVFTMFPRKSKDETTCCYFEVSNLTSAIKDLSSEGGRVIAGPFSLPVDGKHAHAAVMADPDGNGVGIFELKG